MSRQPKPSSLLEAWSRYRAAWLMRNLKSCYWPPAGVFLAFDKLQISEGRMVWRLFTNRIWPQHLCLSITGSAVTWITPWERSPKNVERPGSKLRTYSSKKERLDREGCAQGRKRKKKISELEIPPFKLEPTHLSSKTNKEILRDNKISSHQNMTSLWVKLIM